MHKSHVPMIHTHIHADYVSNPIGSEASSKVNRGTTYATELWAPVAGTAKSPDAVPTPAQLQPTVATESASTATPQEAVRTLQASICSESLVPSLSPANCLRHPYQYRNCPHFLLPSFHLRKVDGEVRMKLPRCLSTMEFSEKWDMEAKLYCTLTSALEVDEISALTPQ